PSRSHMYSLSLHDALPIWLYSHWKQVGQMESNATCTVSAAIPSDVTKRTDLFPQYLADYLATTAPNIAKHAETMACSLSSDSSKDRKSTRLNSSHVKISYA